MSGVSPMSYSLALSSLEGGVVRRMERGGGVRRMESSNKSNLAVTARLESSDPGGVATGAKRRGVAFGHTGTAAWQYATAPSTSPITTHKISSARPAPTNKNKSFHQGAARWTRSQWTRSHTREVQR